MPAFTFDGQSRLSPAARSESPSRKDAVAAYYEIALHGVHRAVVRRWQADTNEGTRREQIAYAITHEVLAKLVEDITTD